MAPGGLFCMSGPVAHADDEDDDHCGYLQIQQGALFQPLSLGSKKGSAALQEPADKQDSGGTCKMLWSSDACYKGEVLDGNLHGVGTYTGADGTVYDGNWILNKKHGFGEKKYVTGDVYEGSWKWDMPEGQGHYLWNDGSEYCGEWRKGLMSGIGVLTWAGGDSYDGQWLNGLADGHGVYTWADGSVYMGTWKEGLKVGPGRYFSPGRKSADDASMPAACMSFQTTSVIGDAPINSLKQSKSDSKSATAAEEDCHSCHDYLKNSVMSAQPHTLTAVASPDKEQESLLILERLQKMDSTISLLKFEDTINAYKPLDKRRSSAFCREQAVDIISPRKSDFDMLSTRHEEKPGQVVDESHRSYNLVTALQLGIRYSVLEASSKDQGKKLSPGDFGPKATVKVNLPKGSTQHSTDYLDIADFQWTDYCPTIFRQLRGMSKIVGASYCQSICGTAGLRELPSPGKSGCLFYLTQDDRFMIKTLRKAEVKVRHFSKCFKGTVSTFTVIKILFSQSSSGLHGVKLAGGQKVRVVVMGNVFASKCPMGRIYDLKGSSEGRIANKSEKSAFAPMKDLDLDVVLQLEPSSRQNILEQIGKDCKFLESERIMDYSLLLGLQFKDSKHDKACSQAQCSMVDIPLHKVAASNFTAEYGDNVKPDIKGFLEDSNPSRRFSFETSGLEQETHIAHLDLEQAIKHGIQQHSAKMFCKTFQESLQADCDAQEVMLYFGIIDILQEYDLGKRLEHAYKSLYFDPLTISAVDPALYSKRFQQLMHRVFVEITGEDL
ncbi:hypothetical protein GOP47_0003591 [Adiantum capillus-veneris]|uniref:Phosphatidylinositol 4-phosphate 5-kinase n=1 Tax=Adiantum capillus-veneris TaxID=13818 RepID=A0A9D4ZLT7_ADICA|nr:hypothetical protein GOP47_0003591 [Adiantum capillus-veneris]